MELYGHRSCSHSTPLFHSLDGIFSMMKYISTHLWAEDSHQTNSNVLSLVSYCQKGHFIRLYYLFLNIYIIVYEDTNDKTSKIHHSLLLVGYNIYLLQYSIETWVHIGAIHLLQS